MGNLFAWREKIENRETECISNRQNGDGRASVNKNNGRRKRVGRRTATDMRQSSETDGGSTGPVDGVAVPG
jgi:hypothetical protein